MQLRDRSDQRHRSPEGRPGRWPSRRAAGATGPPSCNDAWITVTGGASGTGNGTTDYSVAANTGGVRTGTCTIAGETFTVNQARGADLRPAALALTPLSQGVLKLGDTVEVQPSWRNDGAAATADMTGTATASNGGTIVDGAASYGVVGDRRDGELHGRERLLLADGERARGRRATGTSKLARRSASRRATSGCCTWATASRTCRGRAATSASSRRCSTRASPEAARRRPTARRTSATRGQMAVFALAGQGGRELLAAGLRRDADVHGRAGDEPVLQVGRGAGAARHRRWLRGDDLLPERGRDPRADADLHAEDARPGDRPAGLRDADVRGRAGVEPVLQVDRGAGAARCGRAAAAAATTARRIP